MEGHLFPEDELGPGTSRSKRDSTFTLAMRHTVRHSGAGGSMFSKSSALHNSSPGNCERQRTAGQGGVRQPQARTQLSGRRVVPLLAAVRPRGCCQVDPSSGRPGRAICSHPHVRLSIAGAHLSPSNVPSHWRGTEKLCPFKHFPWELLSTERLPSDPSSRVAVTGRPLRGPTARVPPSCRGRLGQQLEKPISLVYALGGPGGPQLALQRQEGVNRDSCLLVCFPT